MRHNPNAANLSKMLPGKSRGESCCAQPVCELRMPSDQVAGCLSDARQPLLLHMVDAVVFISVTTSVELKQTSINHIRSWCQLSVASA